MALSPTVLYRGQPGTTATALYTVADTSGKYALVKSIVIHNPTASAVGLALHSVASGDSAEDANKFFDAEIASGDTVMIEGVFVLGQDETLNAIAGTADAVTVVVSGAVN